MPFKHFHFRGSCFPFSFVVLENKEGKTHVKKFFQCTNILQISIYEKVDEMVCSRV